MDESVNPRRKRSASRARERYNLRQRRRVTMATISSPFGDRMVQTYHATGPWRERIGLWLRDAAWHLRNTPIIPAGLALIAGVLFMAFTVSHLVNGRIFPNVWALGINLGDMTAEEAEAALLDAWQNRMRIRLEDEGRVWTAHPADLGMSFDARPVIEAARAVGMAGIPMGWAVEPVIALEYITAQNFLLDVAQQVQVAPFNAGYEMRDGQVVGVAGRMGRMMDVGLTMDRLAEDPVKVVREGRLVLHMTPLPPDVTDPEPFLDEARAFTARPFQINGYDPYLNQTISWGTTPEVVASWLETGPDSLTLRDDTFLPFLDAQNQSLATGSDPRYLDATETTEKMRQAISTQSTAVNVRIRYRPMPYTVVAGDTATAIARKTGIPFYLIEQSNPGRNLNVLSIGDTLNLPSRDVALPVDPVPNKRIVVDLRTQSLVAYENGQQVFSWLISSGMSEAPTSPGIYQILSHNEVASGSSYTLCNVQGCGQWKMYWFMGIYEVVPGLMNGFHGAVLLPNGAYLGGGNVGAPYTFGCVMSQDDNARMLYEWADLGTIVEIVSAEYPPRSDLARMAFG